MSVSWLASSSARAARPSRSSTASAAASASRRAGWRRKAARVTFSRTDRRGNGFTIWKVRPRPRFTTACGRRATPQRAPRGPPSPPAGGRSPPTEGPPSRPPPADGRRKPVTRLKTVVFPAPFGPMSPRISPSFTSKERSPTARRPPQCRVSRSTSRSAMRHPPRAAAGEEPVGAPPDALRHEADDEHHAEPVDDEVADLQALPHRLGQGREEEGPDERAAHRAEPAHHGAEDHLH